ncbi:hypothetical protein M0R88_16840 [Halorussus gelatinilyticus]|uniref:Uncharacterized protein n=1 Tax=Halorussus gelatinilyticus TaxID=2937524 RepID=A0A8U0IGG2_9EURY|nr:hypothetical protein [Halorussus gelatinilyticus]UPW00167.1 hypothetical protein M0R88_16840 [Halorussus gelatinilyticus]
MIPTPKDAAKVLVGKPLNVRKDRLNVASFVVQAALALRNGKPKRAFLLLGAASVAPKHPAASWLVQGAVTANDVRKKLF